MKQQYSQTHNHSSHKNYSHNDHYTLEITADNQLTVLERLLQVTRYRGFLVTDFSVFPSQNETMLDIKLTVHDGKDTLSDKKNNIRKLSLQLKKLFDINHVNITPTMVENFESKSAGFNHVNSNHRKFSHSDFNNSISV